MTEHQARFDWILDMYNQGHEPLQNWLATHLLALIQALEAELDTRGLDGDQA